MSDKEIKLVSQEALKCLLRGCKIENWLVLQQQMQKRFNLDWRDPPLNFTFDSYVELLEFLRTNMYGDKPFDEGYMALGQCVLAGYLEGPTGAINKMAAKIGGPVATLQMFVSTIANISPNIDHEIEELREGYFRYRLDKIIIPSGYMGGTLKGVFQVLGVQNLQFKWYNPIPTITVYEASWTT